jgi:hypothetical protein
MSIDERQRHELYEGLAGALGRERVDALMAHLPPVGWADVATKQDLRAQEVLVRTELARVEEVLSLRMEVMESRLHAEIADFRAEVHGALRTQLWGILGGIGGSVFGGVLLNAVVT